MDIKMKFSSVSIEMDWRTLSLLACFVAGCFGFKMPALNDDSMFLEEFSSYMNQNIDKSIDPCRDFHGFACGNFKDNSHLGDVVRTTSVYKQLQNNTYEYIRKVLEESQDEILKVPKHYFQECLVYTKEQRLLDMDEILQSSEKYVEDWRTLTFDGIEELLYINTHHPESRQHIRLSGPTLRSTYEPNGYSALKENFGMSKYFDYSEDDYKKVQEFTKAYITLLENGQKAMAKASLNAFINHYSAANINWNEFFKTVSYGMITNSTQIYSAMHDFGPVLKFIRNTSPRVVFNYIKWTKVKKDYGYLLKNFTDKNAWKSFCTEEVMSKFRVALSSVVLKELVNSDRRSDLLKIAKSIRDRLYHNFDEYDWLDDSTKAFMKTNLKALEIFVGYTDDLIDANMSQKHYNGLGITEEDNFLTMNKKYVNFTKRNKFLKIGYPLEITTFISNLDPNAYAIRNIHSVVILATYMQLPMYHNLMPLSMKYSGIGAIIGHEITHVYDGKYWIYDYNYKNRSDLISNFAKVNYNERKACFESQYNKYSIEDYVNNGLQTLNENMSDNGGIKISYEAYVQAVGNETLNSYNDQRVLMNLDTKFTNRQIFFLQSAQIRCNSLTLDQIKEYYSSNLHSYDKFRINGMLSNMKEFSDAFKCPLGSNMNPLKKCELW